MRLDLATILSSTGARVIRLPAGDALPDGQSPGFTPLHTADLEVSFTGVAIDSRRVAAGNLFVALPGERTDGHDHVADALRAGARGALVARVPPERLDAGETSRYFLLVDDPLRALQRLATSWREGLEARVIGITGSIGKTTTKEILAGVLSHRGPVLRSAANFNTEIGLPLTLLDLRPEHWAAVLEMGMYAAGDIALLAEIAQPEIGIVTNVAPVHLERMGSIERIARAKSELVASLPPDGLAVLNGDDPWTRAMAVTSGVAPSRLVGTSPDCDYRAEELRGHGLDGISFRLVAEGVRLPFRTSIPGTHTLHAILASIAVGRYLGMSWSALQEAVAEAELDERQRFIRDGPALIIDDSYNAAPMSVRAALDLLGHTTGTKIAVLGDMLELGPLEESSHREVGARVAEVADWLVARGPRTRWIAEEAQRRGMRPERVRFAASNREAAEIAREIMEEGTAGGSVAILVKGSRGLRMEEVVDDLRTGVGV
jgi:UDP-N-acetylmuramoyl-tripeptide--D-alanyl-D-alanine ligase